MAARLDPAVADALEQAVGHPLPVQDDEWAAITDLHIKHARDLGGLQQCQDLTLLTLRGCDPVHLDQVAGLAKLDALVVNDSGLTSLDGLSPEHPPLLLLDLTQNLLTDLTPLIALPHLENVKVDGNPLTSESYEEVVPALRGRGARVTCSGREEWQLTLRLQAAGLPYCCYRDGAKLRLNSPGLRHTDTPEAGHPVVTVTELEEFLDSDPQRIHELFARRDQAWLLD